MKKLSKILCVIFAITCIAGCSSNENDTIETPVNTTINAKWTVNNSTEYKSFEFNDSGNYIITKNAADAKKTTTTNEIKTIFFGTYIFIDDNTLELSDFGTLTIDNMDEKAIHFTLKLNNNTNTETFIEADREEEITNSTNTELLCRTWQLISIDGQNVLGTDEELTVLFSRAGTYFVTNNNPLEEGGLAEWNWTDSTQTFLEYSWNKGLGSDGIVEVSNLTSTSLTITEDGEIFILEPISNQKTSKTDTKKYSGVVKSGIFKR